jgi:hypothetical protein
MLYYADPKYERWRQYVERRQSEPRAADDSGRTRSPGNGKAQAQRQKKETRRQDEK